MIRGRSPSSPPAWEPGRTCPAGITLVELLVVCGILVIVMGVGLALVRQVQSGYRVKSAAFQMDAMLRLARNRAIFEKRPVCVEIDREANSIALVGQKPIGLWHFEDTSGSGAFDQTAEIRGGKLAPGKYGLCLLFPEGGTLHGPEVPILSPHQGIALDWWLWLELPPTEPLLIARLGELLRVEVLPTLQIRAGIGAQQSTSGKARIPARTWNHVAVLHDGRRFQLRINGYLVQELPGTLTWPPGAARLLMGSADPPLQGKIDELRLFLIVQDDAYTFPRQVKILSAPPRVCFSPLGKLDSSEHQGALTIQVGNERETREIHVGLLGTME